MIDKGWATELAINGVTGKNQWGRADKGKTGTREMMLDSDICLAYRHTENLAEGNVKGDFLLAG